VDKMACRVLQTSVTLLSNLIPAAMAIAMGMAWAKSYPYMTNQNIPMPG
jgi:hypothetical protein